MSITGTGPALVTVDDNGSEEQHTNVLLPYTTTAGPGGIVGIGAQTASSSPSATLTCSITGNSLNIVPVTKTSTGAYTTVNCSTTG